MKKILLIFIVCFLFLTNVNALVNTKERTAPNYGINKKLNLEEDEKRKNTLDIPYVDANEKIYDFTDTLTTSQIETLYNKAVQFEEKTKMDIVVLITNMNRYKTSDDYAMDFYDYNDFGINHNNYSGLIFIIDLTYASSRYANIWTDGDATLYYDYARLESILDDVYIGLKSEDYNMAASTFIDKASYYYDQGIPDSNSGYKVDENGNLVKKYSLKNNLLFGFIFSTVITGIVIIILVFKNKMVKKATKAKEYLDKNSINYTARDDIFVSTHTTTVKISSDSGSGGSSGGGGSRMSSGSSGRSHGGGGGRSF